MSHLDELGQVAKRVQEAIDKAWTHLGQVSALEKEVEILESMHIRDTDGMYEHAKKLIPFFKIRESQFCNNFFFWGGGGLLKGL